MFHFSNIANNVDKKRNKILGTKQVAYTDNRVVQKGGGLKFLYLSLIARTPPLPKGGGWSFPKLTERGGFENFCRKGVES